MRYIAIAISFCFLLAPLEAKTHSNGVHILKVKKNKKGHKAPKHHKATAHRNLAN